MPNSPPPAYEIEASGLAAPTATQTTSPPGYQQFQPLYHNTDPGNAYVECKDGGAVYYGSGVPVLPPTVPPGGVEGPTAPGYPLPQMPPIQSMHNPAYNMGFTATHVATHGPGYHIIAPTGYPITNAPPFCPRLRDGSQTPRGGRYYVNSRGFIEHLTAEQYQHRRVVHGILSVSVIIICLILFFVILRIGHVGPKKD